MHTGGLYGDYLEQAHHYGWQTENMEFKHDWGTLKDNVRSLEFTFRFNNTSNHPILVILVI
jgi:hypothetical protein